MGFLQDAIAAQNAKAGKKQKKGGLPFDLPDLGVGELIGELGAIPAGLLRLGTSLAPGGEKASEVWGGLGKGAASSLASTVLSAVDAAALGQAHGMTDPLRKAAAFGDERYVADDIFGQIKDRGLLPALVENVGNVALLGGAAGAVTKAGAAGRLAQASRTAGKAGIAGFGPDDIARAAEAAGPSRAGRAARFAEAEIPAELRPAGKAAAKARGLEASPEAIAQASKRIGQYDAIASPYRTLFSEAIRPLGKAATARLMADGGLDTTRLWRGEGLADEGAAAALDGFAADAADASVKPGIVERTLLEDKARLETDEPFWTVVDGEAVQLDDAGKVTKLAEIDEQLVPYYERLESARAASKLAGESRGRWFTPEREYAENYLPADGTLKYVDVPRRVAEETSLTGKQHPLVTDERIVTEPENLLPADLAAKAQQWVDPSTIGGPVERTVRAEAAQPVPGWASAAVDRLPGFANKALSRGDRFIDARRNSQVLRERVRTQDTARRQLLRSPVIAEARKLAEDEIRGRALPDGTRVTPIMADDLIGDEVIARLDLTKTLEETITDGASPEVTALVREALQGAGARAESRLPDEWLTGADGAPTQLSLRIDETVGRMRVLNEERLETLRSTDKGAAALEDAGARGPKLSKKSERLTKGADKDLAKAARLEELHVPKEAARQQRLIDLLERRIAGTDEAATRATARVDEAGIDFDATRSGTDAIRTPVEQAAGEVKGQAGMFPRQVRTEADIYKELRADPAWSSRPAAAARAEAKRLVAADRAHWDSFRPDESLRSGPEFDEVRVGEQAELGGPFRTEAQRAQSLLPGADDLTKHGVYREGVKGGRNIERIRYEARKAAELEQRKVKLQKNVDAMKATLTDGTLPSQREAERLRTRAGKATAKVAKQLEEPKLDHVPAAWKPVWGAITDLHKAAEDNPLLAEALEDLPKTWSSVLELAEAKGFDPTHVRSFQPSEVRQLVYGNVQLGKKGRDLGQTIEAGTLKSRSGAQARTRSLSALAAASIEATHMLHTNALSRFVDETWARDVVDGTIPDGWVGWDDERSFLLSGQRQADKTTTVAGTGAPTKMIPRSVKANLDNYQKDFSHTVFSGLRKAIDPWRLFLLTLSPRWYVNNFVGNLMLTAKEGVRLQDWAKARDSYRRGGVRTDASYLERTFGPGRDAFSGPEAGAIEGGVFTEGGEGTLIPYPKGREGFSMAREIGKKEALGQIGRSIRRGNEVVDELARVATYHANIRKGFSHEKALQRTYDALIDYNDLCPFERQLVRSVVPFYAWQKGILKLTARFPIDHPQVAGILLSFERVQQELSEDHFGGELPDYYRGVVDLPLLGPTNLRGVNPFQDSKSLTTPQGIAGSMNPFVESAVRNALGAPEGGFADEYRINEFGTTVPDTSPVSDFFETIGSLPQVRVGESVTGTHLSGMPEKPAGQAVGQFVGVPRYSKQQVADMIQRMIESRAREVGRK